MDKISRIRELMRAVSGTNKPTFSFRLMEVVSVDGDLCRAKMDDFEIPDIRLASIEKGSENGILIVPKTGSVILVADISCGSLRELNAVGYSEIESIRIHKENTTVTLDEKAVEVKVGSSTVHVEDGKIQLNEGDNGGLVIIQKLQDSLQSLKSYCEALKSAVSAGINGVGAGAAANGATGAGVFDSQMAGKMVNIEKMENEKVKH